MTPTCQFCFPEILVVQKLTRILQWKILAANSSDRYQKVIEDAIENQL
jgi:hypothetical protein